MTRLLHHSDDKETSVSLSITNIKNNMAKHKPKFGVFLALTFGDAIYRDYPAANCDIKHAPFHNMIITLREDGYFGFLGGTAEDGETELQALTRECKEEGNLDLAEVIAEAHMTTNRLIDRVCEHTLGDGFKVILYHIRITKEIAKKVLRNAVDAEHFFTETAGLNSVVIHSKSSFHKNAFLSCMREEFVELAKIIGSDVLEDWGTKH